jgi:hypothetical protein
LRLTFWRISGPTTYEALSQHFKLPALGSKVVSGACKAWPDDPSLTLAAVAYDSGTADEKSLLVAMVQKEPQRVIASYETSILEDAVTEVGANSLQLDTAPYRLAANTRAFGVRFESTARGASCGEASWNDELTLYVPAGQELLPVLTLSMWKMRALKGCLSAWSPEAILETVTLTLSVAKTTSHGFADLLATAAVSTSANDETTRVAKPRTEHYVLRYNGNEYQKDGKARWWLRF